MHDIFVHLSFVEALSLARHPLKNSESDFAELNVAGFLVKKLEVITVQFTE